MCIRDRLERIANRTAKVGVVGLGYVGLPLAVEFGQAGFSVTGIDLDARKVDQINRRESYIQDVPTEAVAALVTAGEILSSLIHLCLPPGNYCSIWLGASHPTKNTATSYLLRFIVTFFHIFSL